MGLPGDTIKITEILHRVKSLEVFRSKQTRKRILHMPYYHKTKDALIFNFIHEETDVSNLKLQIELGEIYIYEQHVPK